MMTCRVGVLEYLVDIMMIFMSLFTTKYHSCKYQMNIYLILKV